MKSSFEWIGYFSANSEKKRIDWTLKPTITRVEEADIIESLQAWQLGETSDGKNLIAASEKYADKVGDWHYVAAIKLFIKEEQKHGDNLGKYLDAIDHPRIKKNWGDSLFRKIRALNKSMEWWTLAVITVECAAQIYYQALKDATGCALLKQICTDILIDEAPHIQFQKERLEAIFSTKTGWKRQWTLYFYQFFFIGTATLIWIGHRQLFKAGKVNLGRYTIKMFSKYCKTIGRIGEGAAKENSGALVLSINC